MQRHELGGGVEIVGRLDALDAELAEAVLRHERVVGDDAHLEAERAARDLLSDPPEAEHAERLARELDAAEARALPAPLSERRVRLRDVPRQREQQRDRVLRRGDDRRLGRVRDDDPAPRGRVDVDVVHAHARASDHLQALRLVDQLLRQLRRRADDDAVVSADDGFEVGVVIDVDVEVLAQQVDAGVRDPFANENARAQTVTGCSYASNARVVATPRSISAPSSVSASSTAASAVAMSKTSK